MPIPFSCPHCGHATSVDERYAGQSGSCVKCGRAITVPQLAGAMIGPSPAARPGGGMGTGAMIAIVLGVVGVGGICVIVILIALLLPAVQSARGAARRASSQNNMKQIMLAMHNYHDVWQAFPAAYTEDSQGNRLHSWRTSLLPYFEQQALYGQIDQSQPWDSGMNASAAGTDIIIFRSPSDAAIAPGETSYVAVTGQGFLFDGPNYTRIADIMDGTSNTVAFVEAASPGIQWAEPRDLTEEDLSTLVGPDPGGLNVAFADGSVRFLDASQTDPQTLRALLTIRGGEMVPLGY